MQKIINKKGAVFTFPARVTLTIDDEGHVDPLEIEALVQGPVTDRMLQRYQQIWGIANEHLERIFESTSLPYNLFVLHIDQDIKPIGDEYEWALSFELGVKEE